MRGHRLAPIDDLNYQLEAEKRFPRRIKIGVRAVGWIQGEVQQWVVQRIERSRSSSARSP
jgi:prophage regulatory protein